MAEPPKSLDEYLEKTYAQRILDYLLNEADDHTAHFNEIKSAVKEMIKNDQLKATERPNDKKPGSDTITNRLNEALDLGLLDFEVERGSKKKGKMEITGLRSDRKRTEFHNNEK